MCSAAMEEQVFKKDDSAFVDLGVSGGVSGGINLKDVFNAEIGVGGEIFKRFDNASLKASMGDDDFGAKVQSEEQARARSKKASGRTVTSMGVSAIVGVAINGQNVEFAGSLSMEDAENIKEGDKNEVEHNWGVEISASIGAGSDPLTKFEKMAAGIVTGALGVVAGLVKAWETKKRGAGIDILADITQIVNAGLENQITSSLGELASADGSKFDEGILTHITNPDAVPDPTSALGTSSSLQVAITFGKSSGKGVFRFEIRDSKSLDLSVGLGSASLSISASKGSRLLAVGYEEGGFATEAIGLRGPKSK
jgi:hypothetical protein